MWGPSDFQFPLDANSPYRYLPHNLATKMLSFLDAPALTKEHHLCSEVPRLSISVFLLRLALEK
jgi:hypothetical protein